MSSTCRKDRSWWGRENRAQDAAIVKPLSSALINRLAHVQLRASVTDWLAWAGRTGIHGLVIDYIRLRPDHLWSKPQKHEEPFSTPRSWHILSDSLKSYDTDALAEGTVDVLASGLITPAHARQFVAFYRQRAPRLRSGGHHQRGGSGWPEAPEERDILYFLVQSFRAQLIKELPAEGKKAGQKAKALALSAKDRLVQLSRISLEMAQLVVAEEDDGTALPDWFMVEIARDLPRLVAPARLMAKKRQGKYAENLKAISSGLSLAGQHPLIAPLPGFDLRTTGLALELGKEEWLRVTMRQGPPLVWHDRDRARERSAGLAQYTAPGVHGRVGLCLRKGAASQRSQPL